MTRDEFMKIAYEEIDQMLVTQRNRMIGLVERAWAEGKKNAEASSIEQVVKEALDRLYPSCKLVESDIEGMECPTGSWEIVEAMKSNTNGEIPAACVHCSNHPSNGGSGICFCTLGTPKIT